MCGSRQTLLSFAHHYNPLAREPLECVPVMPLPPSSTTTGVSTDVSASGSIRADLVGFNRCSVNQAQHGSFSVYQAYGVSIKYT